MNHKLKIFILFIITLICSYLMSPYIGKLYESIIGHHVSGGWLGTCSECYDGFLIIFPLFIGLLFFSLLDKKRINVTLIFILIAPLFLLIMKVGEAFIMSLIASIVGLGLGQIIYLIRKKYCHKKITT